MVDDENTGEEGDKPQVKKTNGHKPQAQQAAPPVQQPQQQNQPQPQIIVIPPYGNQPQSPYPYGFPQPFYGAPMPFVQPQYQQPIPQQPADKGLEEKLNKANKTIEIAGIMENAVDKLKVDKDLTAYFLKDGVYLVSVKEKDYMKLEGIKYASAKKDLEAKLRASKSGKKSEDNSEGKPNRFLFADYDDEKETEDAEDAKDTKDEEQNDAEEQNYVEDARLESALLNAQVGDHVAYWGKDGKIYRVANDSDDVEELASNHADYKTTKQKLEAEAKVYGITLQ